MEMVKPCFLVLIQAFSFLFTCLADRVKALKSGLIPSLNLPETPTAAHTHSNSKQWTVTSSCCSALHNTCDIEPGDCDSGTDQDRLSSAVSDRWERNNEDPHSCRVQDRFSQSDLL